MLSLCWRWRKARAPVDHDLRLPTPKTSEIDHRGAHRAAAVDNDIDDRPMFSSTALRTSRP
jgi:hypothetical protein